MGNNHNYIYCNTKSNVVGKWKTNQKPTDHRYVAIELNLKKLIQIIVINYIIFINLCIQKRNKFQWYSAFLTACGVANTFSCHRSLHNLFSAAFFILRLLFKYFIEIAQHIRHCTKLCSIWWIKCFIIFSIKKQNKWKSCSFVNPELLKRRSPE